MKREEFWNEFYMFMWLMGSILLVLSFQIYNKTFIHIYIPILILFTTGFLTHLLSKKRYNTTYLGNIFSLSQHIFSWGSIACYLFMAINFYYNDGKLITHNLGIKEKNSISGGKGQASKRKPIIRINYQGFSKKLVFRYEETYLVKIADSVKINLNKGVLGFEVIDTYVVYN